MYRVFFIEGDVECACMYGFKKKLLLVNNCFTYPHASMGKIAKII